MRLPRATTVLVMAAGVFVPPYPASAAPPIRCAVSLKLPGVGDACRRADGLLELYAPRTGRFLGLTHGPDRPDATTEAAAPSSGSGMTYSQRPVVCTDPSDHHIELIYARPVDDINQYSSRSSDFRIAFERVNWTLNAAAQATGTGSADFNVRCDRGTAVVWNAVLPTRKANDSFSSIMSDLSALGYANSRTKYLVFYDDPLACGCVGIGQAPADDRLTSDNAALRGPMYGVVLSTSTRTVMHELGHTLGAVQNSAPHSTQAAHCYDGLDVMCYPDGGPRSNLYSSSYCATPVFDCNKDDYFNSNPAAGSYLATHWNLGSRLNRYVRFPALPDTVPPTVVVTEPRAGMVYLDGCASRASVTGSGRPAFHGRGCVGARATDAETGVDRLEIYFDNRLVVSLRQLPMATLSFDLGRGTGFGIPLKIVATDFAEIPSGPNVTTTTLLVDIV